MKHLLWILLFIAQIAFSQGRVPWVVLVGPVGGPPPPPPPPPPSNFSGSQTIRTTPALAQSADTINYTALAGENLSVVGVLVLNKWEQVDTVYSPGQSLTSARIYQVGLGGGTSGQVLDVWKLQGNVTPGARQIIVKTSAAVDFGCIVGIYKSADSLNPVIEAGGSMGTSTLVSHTFSAATGDSLVGFFAPAAVADLYPGPNTTWKMSTDNISGLRYLSHFQERSTDADKTLSWSFPSQEYRAVWFAVQP